MVFVAKLTHYTGRKQERAKLFDVLAVDYCAKSADRLCNIRVAEMKDHFSRFPIGDDPKFTPYPVTLTTVDAPVPKPLATQIFETGKALPLKQ
jgi:hypothetical protein